MGNELIVIGASGFAKEVAWLAEECGYELKGFLDDSPSYCNTQVLNKPVLGSVDDWINFGDCEFIIGIGEPETRSVVVEKMTALGKPKFATLIHPNVVKSKYVDIGEGSIICAGAIITTDVRIGDHVVINLNCTVGHDVLLHNFVTIAPMVAISGNVTLKDLVEIGTSASIRQGITVARNSMLGMGSVLTKDIASPALYFGAPAKRIKSKEGK